jgi:hypothetical protein
MVLAELNLLANPAVRAARVRENIKRVRWRRFGTLPRPQSSRRQDTGHCDRVLVKSGRRSTAGPAVLESLEVNTMKDFEAQAWLDSAQAYQHLRRLAWLFLFGFVGTAVALFAGCFYAAVKNWGAFAFILLVLLIPASCIIGLGMMITWFELSRFCCPRCGKRFVKTWWNQWPTDRCKHCKLDLGTIAKDPSKSPALAELWE